MKKIILWITIIILLGSLSFAALTDDIMFYYTFDNGDFVGNELEDMTGNGHNGTNNGAATGSGGIIGESWDFERGDSDYVDISDTLGDSFNGTANFTWNIWVKLENVTHPMYILGYRDESASYLVLNNNSGVTFQAKDSGATWHYATAVTNIPDGGSWTMLTAVYDVTNSNMSVWVNGTYTEYLNWAGAFTEDANDNRISDQGHGGNYFDGLIDEYGTWNRALDGNEIKSLWNSGSGLSYPFTIPTPPGDTLNLSTPIPVNDSAFNTLPIFFNLTANATYNFTCNLTINNTFNNSLPFNSGSNVNVSFEVNFTDGHYDYNITCFDNTSNESTGTFEFFVDFQPPVVNATSFINNSMYYKRNLTGQFNFTDNDQLHSLNVTIDGSTIFNITHIHEPFYSYNLTYNVTNLTAGIHDLALEISDGHTDEVLKSPEAYNPTNGLFNNYLKYEFEEPYQEAYIEIKGLPSSLFDTFTTEYNGEDRYKIFYEPNELNNEYTFEVESDKNIYIYNSSIGEYGGQWLVIGEHWLDFNIPQEPNLEVSITKINDYKAEVTISGFNPNTELFEFNSIGDLNIETYNYTFLTINATEAFENPILNGFNTNLLLNITGTNGTIPSATLQWNGTNYTADILSSNTTLIAYNQTIFSNLTFTDNVLVTHKWFFNLTNNESTTLRNQTLYNITVEPCINSSYFVNNTILNISYYDEIDGSSIQVDSNTYDFVVFDGTYYYNQTGVFLNSTNNSFCTNLPPENITYNWNLWGSVLTLREAGYATRMFDISEGLPTIISNNPPTNLLLYLIELNDSATVIYEWFTTEFQSIDGTMRIFRCQNGSDVLVESVPIINARAVANIELLTQPYRYDIIYNGLIYEDEDSFSRCHVEAETTVRFYVDVGTLTVDELIGLEGITCSLTREETNNTVTMTWTSNPEDSTYVQGCIIAYRQSVTNNIEVYNNCSVEADGYSRTVTIPASGYTYTVIGELRQGNNTAYCADTIEFYTSETSAELFGTSGLIAVFLLIAAMILFYAGDGEIQLVGAAIGFMSAWILGIFNFGFIVSTSVVLFLGLIIAIGRYNR